MIQKLTPQQYHAAGRTGPLETWTLSKSLLMDFAQSPYVWRKNHDKGIKREATASMDWGSAVDCLATTPELYDSTVAFVDAAAWTGKAAQEERKAIRSAGKIPMLEKDRARVAEAAWMLENHMTRHGLDVAEKQICATSAWTGPSGNVYRLKCLADFWKPMADLKTTNSLDGRDLARTIREYFYHAQMALYHDIFRANGEEVPECPELHFQESTEPFRTRIWRLTPDDIAAGRKAYLEALALWDYCVTLDVWPGEELDMIEGRNATYAND